MTRQDDYTRRSVPTAAVLTAVFAAHNLEEYANFDRDRERLYASPLGARLNQKWYRRDTMAMALVMLTGLAGAMLATPKESPHPVGDGAGLLVSSALGFNAVTHGMRAVVDRRYNGGLATSPLMFTAATLTGRRLMGRGALSARQERATIGAGVVLVPFMIVGSLDVSSRILRYFQGHHTPPAE